MANRVEGKHTTSAAWMKRGASWLLGATASVLTVAALADAQTPSKQSPTVPAQTYTKENTALLIVDPYNDFMSEGGKLYKQTLETAKEVGFYENMRKLVPAARAAGIPVFIVPHHKAEKNDYENWYAVTSSQKGSARVQLFGAGTWGGEWNPEFGPKPGDVIIKEHWAQSGFANTDLDQQLKQRGIRRVIVVGFLANTCIESTGRFAMELGYHVTLVKDATAATSKEAMHAAHDINGPTFAHAILTTSDLLAALPKS